jgi:hypothetical protein
LTQNNFPPLPLSGPDFEKLGLKLDAEKAREGMRGLGNSVGRLKNSK